MLYLYLWYVKILYLVREKNRETASGIWTFLSRNMRFSVPFFCWYALASALASPSSGCVRFLGLSCLSSTADAMVEVPAAGAWLLLTHAALPVAALLALTWSH